MTKLWYNPSLNPNRTGNNSMQRGRGGGRFFGNNQSRSRNDDQTQYGDKILQIEKVGKGLIGLNFQGFFDAGLKDIIKGLDYTRFEYERKVWILAQDKKTEMIDEISHHCVDNNIQVGDVPKFVSEIVNTPIPFSKVKGKIVKDAKFNYVEEI